MNQLQIIICQNFDKLNKKEQFEIFKELIEKIGLMSVENYSNLSFENKRNIYRKIDKELILYFEIDKIKLIPFNLAI